MANQIVPTPRLFLDAVEDRFGSIGWDLAANKENSVAGSNYYGPGSEHGENSLGMSWHKGVGLMWLNPPFSDPKYPMVEWVKRCAVAQRNVLSPIALLIPAAVCTTWFRNYVGSCAYVFELFPRVFSKEIRDCCLALYTPEGYRGREPWDWKTGR